MKQHPHPKFIFQIFSACLLWLAISTGYAAEIAGTVELVDGTVWIQGTDNKIRSIEINQPLLQGDTIITGKDGELQARMQDEAIIAVRANSKLKIESYRAEGDEDDNAIFSLIVGTFRSVTGWIGKYNRKNYAIKTTAATIGVRGTDHEPMYIPPPVPGMKPLGEPGVYDKVNSGRIVMKNQFGESEFGKGQAGFIGFNAKRAPVKLKNVPDFFKPSRNESRIGDFKKRQIKRLDQGLIKQQRRLQKQNKATPASKSAPKLLNMRRPHSGFAPGPVKPGKDPDRRKTKPRKNTETEQAPQLKPIQRPQPPAPMRNMLPQKPAPLEPQEIAPPTLKPDQSLLRKPQSQIAPALKPATTFSKPTRLNPPTTNPPAQPEKTPTPTPASPTKQLIQPRTSSTLMPVTRIQPAQIKPLQKQLLTRPE